MKTDLPVVLARASIQEARSRLESSGRGAILVKNGTVYGLVPEWKIIIAAHMGKESAGEIQPEARFAAARTRKQTFDIRERTGIDVEVESPVKPDVIYTNFRNRYTSRHSAKRGFQVLQASKERAVIFGPDRTVAIYAFARKRCYCTNPRLKPPHDYDPGSSGTCFCGYPIVC